MTFDFHRTSSFMGFRFRVSCVIQSTAFCRQQTQCIDVPFLRVLDRIRDSERQIRVKHGIILDQSSHAGVADEEFLHEDPMMVLMECMRVMNLRLMDLFASLDKDGSKSLTHDEFKNGLLVRSKLASSTSTCRTHYYM